VEPKRPPTRDKRAPALPGPPAAREKPALAPPTKAAASGARQATADASRTTRQQPSGPQPAEEIDDPISVRLDEVLDGKYRLMQQLDEGGMGSVFVAHNIALDVPVAVKVIRSDFQGPEKHVLAERLLQEARATARLGHPAIVRMMDFGTAPNGDPYLVMELLEGEDLGTALEQRGSVGPTRSVRILLPIAHALAAAHDKGIVHRDLKSENIFLAQTETGQVQPKLIDFGIVKVPQRKPKRLTVVGDAMGTPDYMCPEQARGQDVDAKADIWAFCVLLYEMVTGQLPFNGPNYHALLRAIIEDEPKPISDFGVSDGDLWTILRKGLTKNVRERWSTMRELGTALATWLEAHDVHEDICGASLKSTWLTPWSSGQQQDVFTSVPPPAGIEAAPVVIIPAADDLPSQPISGESAEAPASSPVRTETLVSMRAVRPSPSRRWWPELALWIVAVVGLGWALTGAMHIALPGVPARLPPSWGKWLGRSAEPRAAPGATGSPATDDRGPH